MQHQLLTPRLFPLFHYFHSSPLKGGLIFVISFVFSLSSFGQTFNGQGGLPIPPGAPIQTQGITTSIATVTGMGIIGEGCTFIDHVTIDLNHTFDGDIAIFLIAPSGEVLEFSSSNGGAQDNFLNCTLTDNTALFITQGAPPYTGIWRPEGRQQNTSPPFSNSNPLGTFTFANTFNGLNADGDWVLMINDYVAIDVGTLNSWSITFAQGNGSGVTVDLGADITICPGETTTLNADVDPDADSYAWSTGQSTPSISVNPLITTTYSVTVTLDGCIDVDTIVVTVDPNSVQANAGPDVSICGGTGTTLTGSGGGTGAQYHWSTGQNGQSITVNPNGTTTYTLTVTDGFCMATDQVTVNVTPPPIADAGLPQTVCAGQQTILTASGGNQSNQYSWSTGQTGQTITVFPMVTTTYTVTVNVNGCIDTDDVEIEVNPIPEVEASNDVTICQGQSTLLTVTGTADSYLWSDGQPGDEITVMPNNTTVYTVTGSANGCAWSDQVIVEVVDFVAGISPDQSICEGSSAQLTASGGTDYEWSTGQTTNTISVSPATTTTYFVTVSQNGCSDVQEVEVDVLPIPVALISPDNVTICSGNSATLTATGGTDYDWSNGQSVASITVTPGNSTTYTVTVSDQGCQATATVDVTVNPAPPITIGPDVAICDGDVITLIAGGINGTGEYLWNTGQTTEDIDVNPSITTTYSVTVTNIFGCTTEDQVVVTVNQVPNAQAGIDQTLCEGNTATLTATGGSGTATYQWSSGQLGSTITITPSGTTTYTVTVTDGICSDTDNVDVNVLANPVASAGGDQSICSGQSIDIIGTGGGTYQWNTGAVTAQINVSPGDTTTYIVTVTAANSCTDIDSMVLTVNPLPIAEAGPDQTICAGDQVTLTGTGGNTFLWTTGETSNNIAVNPADTIIYSLTVTDAIGCSNADVVTVNVNPLPVANAGPNVFIMTGGSATLNASGGGTYLWSTGETTATISVSPGATTTYSVTVTLNGCTAVDDITVFVNEAPNVDLGPDLVICKGESITIDATIQGPFTSGYVWSTGETTATIQVAPNATTFYSVTVTDQTSGFSSVDTIHITVNTLPIGNGVINGATLLCQDDTENYFVDPVSGATQYQWMISNGGTITAGQGTTSITVLWTSPGGGQVQLIASNDCGDAPAALLNLEIQNTPNIVGPLNGDLKPCETSTATYTIPTVFNADAYAWTVPAGATILSGQGTNSISVDWNGAVNGDVCVSASNMCGTSGIICVTVNPTLTPTIDAGIDFSICGSTTDLAANGTGSWTLVSGPGTADFAQVMNPNSSVSVSVPGNYTFAYAINQNGCTASDTVTGQFFDEPSITNVAEDCSADHLSYMVSFTITGGTAPFFVSGGTVNGNSFVSMPFAAGVPFGFQVADANGCMSAEIFGQQDCVCTKNAGTMDTEAIDACADETIHALFLGGDQLDSGDTLIFVLHDGNIPDGIIAWSEKPEFDFAPPMSTGTTYFISAIAGTIGTGGLPDLTDPCLSVSTGTPIQFAELPEVNLGDDVTIQLGDSIKLESNSLSPVSYYNWFTADTCTQCPFIIVAPVKNTTYTLQVTNDDGCMAADELNVFVKNAKDIFLPNIFSPNGDQVNDVLSINGGKSLTHVSSFEIFDRWGNLVFRDKDYLPGSPDHGWKGTFNGEAVSPGVFTCITVVEFADGKPQTFVWDVTVIR